MSAARCHHTHSHTHGWEEERLNSPPVGLPSPSSTNAAARMPLRRWRLYPDTNGHTLLEPLPDNPVRPARIAQLPACSRGPRRLHPPDGVGRNKGCRDMRGCGGIYGDTVRRFGGWLSLGRFCAEDMCMMMFGRAFSQNGEMGGESCHRGIAMLYGGYHVVHEVEAAPQKPLWGQKAYKCSGRCSGAGVGIQDEGWRRESL